jgi:hypothetical protein
MKFTVVSLVLPAIALAQKSDEKAAIVQRFSNFVEASGTAMMRSAPSDMSAQDVQLKTRMSKLFARGVRSKYESDGLPDQAAVLMDRNLGAGNSSEYCDPDKGCNSPISLDGIWGYGCWCNFGEHLLTGGAAPVNTFDEICKDMQLCLRCAKMDGENDGYECDPKTVDYNVVVEWMNSDEALFSECEALNQADHCATHCCTCEVDMVNSLIGTIWKMNLYEPEYKHSNGFDRTESCPTNPQHTLSACCGYYPKRFPYSNEVRQCCRADQSLFNPLNKDCCENEGVSPIGSC